MPHKDATFAASKADLSLDPSLDQVGAGLKGINPTCAVSDGQKKEGVGGCQATPGGVVMKLGLAGGLSPCLSL